MHVFCNGMRHGMHHLPTECVSPPAEVGDAPAGAIVSQAAVAPIGGPSEFRLLSFFVFTTFLFQSRLTQQEHRAPHPRARRERPRAAAAVGAGERGHGACLRMASCQQKTRHRVSSGQP